MAYNKIIVNDEVVMDLTTDTVTSDDVKAGVTFHTKSGDTEVGSLVTPAGTIGIDKNGTHDVYGYANAEVNVQPNLQEKVVKEGGEIVPDAGYDGLSKVIIDGTVGGIFPSETMDITENGDHYVYAYEYAHVNVQPNLQEKTATENGEVVADDGYDGLSKVIVNVASSGGGENHKPSLDNSMLVFNVTDYQNNIVSGATITITNTSDSTVYTGMTNENGEFSQELPVGNYDITYSDMPDLATPVAKNVTTIADHTCYVYPIYIEPAQDDFNTTFGENNWYTIASVSDTISSKGMTAEQVEAAYGWKLGDIKSETLSTGEVIELQIIGVNHDDKSDGSGKAGLTLQMVNCLNTSYVMHSSHTNKGGWNGCLMRTTTLPSVKSTFSQALGEVIKTVNKSTANGAGSQYTETIVSSDDLFLPSEIEIFGTIKDSQPGADEGTQYAYWAAHNTDAERMKQRNNDQSYWWLRSPNYDASSDYASSKSYCCVTGYGQAYNYSANYTCGASFAICI